jgi:hypothetical protein
MKKYAAIVISYLFHPIFLVPLMAAYLIFWSPGLYLGLPPKQKMLRFLTVVFDAVLFPLLAVLLARALNFIKSLQMSDPKDRIIPYIATLTFYFWGWRVMNYLPDSPPPMVALFLGIFLSASLGLVLNSFLKISMHTMGAGGLVMFALILGWEGAPGIALPIAIAILIAGLVWTARLSVSDHTNRELSLGFVVGMVCQVAGACFFH